MSPADLQDERPATRVAGSEGPPVSPIHVLHVADWEVCTRFGRMFRQLGLALEDEGVHVSLLTDDPVAAADLANTPIDCQLFPHLHGWRSWRLSGRLFMRFDPLPTLLHLWGTSCLSTVGAWALEADLPVLIHAVALGDVERIAQRGLRRNQHMAVVCERFREAFRQRGSAPSASLPVLGPALIMPDTVDRPPAAEHTLGVIWSGRIDQRCGLELLIEAVAQLRRNGRDVQTVLFGRGAASRTVWRAIRHRNVQDCISLIDEPHLWDRATAGADVCVVTARQRRLSLAPLLAMAHGKIVIASRDQIADWFIEDQTAWQFTPGSAAELAYHLENVTSRRKDAAKLSESAAAHVRQHHSMSRLTTELIRVYDLIRVRPGKAEPTSPAAEQSQEP